MAVERNILAVSVLFLSLAGLAPNNSVLCLLSLLFMQSCCQRQLTAQATQRRPQIFLLFHVTFIYSCLNFYRLDLIMGKSNAETSSVSRGVLLLLIAYAYGVFFHPPLRFQMAILFAKIERKYQAFKHEENKYKCLKSGVELFHAC